MRILFVGMKYDYGKQERGYSFEYYNFFDPLLKMGHDILFFDFTGLLQQHGREWMNARLREVVKVEKPDLLFSMIFEEELDPRNMRDISQAGDTITVNWFCDDHWRFDTFSRRWAPCFNWVVTTAQSALPKYARYRIRHVIKSQWACNHYLYTKQDLPLHHAVTFVGQPHGNRRETINALHDAGIEVQTWGLGWEKGRLAQDEMIRCFNGSRINLNLANASVAAPPTAENPYRRAVAGIINSTPLGRMVKNGIKGALAGLRNQPATQQAVSLPEQIKGRNFEVPGCGGFLLTSPVEDLERYYTPDKEICLFADHRELVEKIHYYLNHEEERAAIAHAGHQRTLCEHTYVHRFSDIFRQVGLPYEDPAEIISRGPQPGRMEEIR